MTYIERIAFRRRKTMQARIDFQKAVPEGLKLLLAFQPYFKNQPGLEPALLNLVFVRASQINGCAPCIDMHTKDALALGETEQRLYELTDWSAATFDTSRTTAAV